MLFVCETILLLYPYFIPFTPLLPSNCTTNIFIENVYNIYNAPVTIYLSIADILNLTRGYVAHYKWGRTDTKFMVITFQKHVVTLSLAYRSISFTLRTSL